MIISSADFGKGFQWGVSTAAYQIEGAYQKDGKGPSIWDQFTSVKGNIQSGHHANNACDFYHRFEQDIDLMRYMGIKTSGFRWPGPGYFPRGGAGLTGKALNFITGCLTTAWRWA